MQSPENLLGFAGLTRVEGVCDVFGGTGGRLRSQGVSGKVSEVGLDTLGNTFTSLDFGVPSITSSNWRVIRFTIPAILVNISSSRATRSLVVSELIAVI